MLYIDTSILVAYYCPEPLSDEAESIILREPGPAISPLTELELASAISRKIRERNLSRTDGNRILNQFRSHVDHHLFKWVPLGQHHFQQAAGWISQFNTPLRTLDALHLSLSAREGAVLVTADLALAKSAKFFGVESLLVKAG